MQQAAHAVKKEAGFSIMELLVAMTVMIFITGAAAALLVSAFNVRAREDQRSEGTADARRALNIISREVASAGYRLPPGLTYATSAGVTIPVPANGLIAGDCNATAITFVSNTNAQGDFDPNLNDTIPDAPPNHEIAGADEAIKFQFVQDETGNFLVRKDLLNGDSLVLANRIDGVQFDFINRLGGAAATIAEARSINIRIWVTLNQVGQPGSSGYQAPSQVTLSSRVNLRNAQLASF
jgi:type II secretory pathway pseudopilin PulG